MIYAGAVRRRFGRKSSNRWVKFTTVAKRSNLLVMSSSSFGARASQADVAAYFGSMDAGSYISYGINFAKHGSFFLNGERFEGPWNGPDLVASLEEHMKR